MTRGCATPEFLLAGDDPEKKAEAVRKRKREWKHANKEKAKASQRRYYLKNKEREAARTRKWYEERKESELIRRKAYRETPQFKALNAEWREKNKERVSALSRNYKARKRDAIGRHTGDDIKSLFVLQRGMCAYCKAKISTYHVDHIIPLASGGSNDKHNIQLLCPPCNQGKRAKHPIDFAQQMGLLL